MVRNSIPGRLHIIFVVAALVLIMSPGSALAKKYLTTSGTVSVSAVGDSQIDVAASYTIDTASNCGNGGDTGPSFYVEWATDTGFSTNYGRYPAATFEQDPNSDANSTWEYSIASGLTCNTSYYVRVVYTDPDGMESCAGGDVTVNASTWPITTGACPANDTTVGTVTSGAQTSSSITITATLTGDGNNNGYCEFYYNTTNNYPGATLSSSCNNVTGASAGANRTCEITGLSASTPYYIWAKYIDTDGVTGGPEVAVTGAPISTSAANDTTVGALTSTFQNTTSVGLEAAYTGDANTNNSVTFEWSLAGQASWNTITDTKTRVGSTWTVTATGLSSGTSYDFRATFSDGDGVTGGAATLNGVSTTSACKSTLTLCTDCHTMPPVDWDGVSAKEGTTGHQGDHAKAAHTGTGTRADCARCHIMYNGMINVTSTARWSFGHANFAMDIYTSNNVANNVYTSPYDKGIKGGYYKGYGSYIMDDNTPGANNVCAATYCHGAGNSPVWGTGSATCGSCHSIPPGASAGKHSVHSGGYVGYKNNSNGTSYDFGCYKCHDPAAHANGPVSTNQAAPVAFDNVSAPTNPTGSYTAGGSVAGTDGTFNWTNGTCSSMYCHSSGEGNTPNTTPTWNGAAFPANCTGCHDNNVGSGNPMATNGHTDHVNNLDANLARFSCVKCHNATVDSDTNISNEANHVDGEPTVSFDGTNPSGSYDGLLNCSNLYCHSSGQATPTYRTPPTWDSATNLTCDGCHGAEGTTLIIGAPEYANNSTADRNSFNGHDVASHVSAVTDCIKCHNSTVNSTGGIKASSAHLDGSRTVDFLDGGSYSNKRCSGTACHGSTVLRWGGTATCEDCHFNTGAIGNETDDYTFGNNTTAQINQTEWQNAGHGRTSGTYSWTQNTAANLGCTDCHSYAVQHNLGTNPFRLTNPNPDTLCTATCHTSATVIHHNSSNMTANYGTANATWSFTPKCVDCHDPHGDTAGGVTPAEYNGAMIQSQVAAAGSADSYGRPTMSGLVNMDFPDDDPATNVDFNYASFQQSDFSGLCQVCHDDSGVVNYSQTANNTSHYSGQGKCTSCHPHNKGFAPSGGSCTGCHKTGGTGSTNRPSMEAEFRKTSHHINITITTTAQFESIDPVTCAVCHLEGKSDGSVDSTYHNQGGVAQGSAYPVNLRVIGTVGASESVTITNNTSGIEFYTGSGPNGGTRSSEEDANSFCLGCHDTTNASSVPFTTTEGAQDLSPSNYDGSYGSIEARYGDTGTTTSHSYNPGTYNVVPNLTKAYSPHGNPANNQMKNVVSGAWSNDSQTNSTDAIGCLDCHNAHGSDALADDGTNFNGITYSSNIGGYKGGLLRTTSTYDPDETTAYSAATDLCFDCHLGDDANAPKDYTNFGAARAVHEYYDAGRWGTSDTWSPTFSYKNGDNSGNMRGGHFGASSALTNSASGINGSCMACHDPHGTPTGGYIGTGTTRARMAPALKGTWMSSPYKEDRVADTGSATDSNTYGGVLNGNANGSQARITPAFAYNNPANLGAGFGTGNNSFGTYAAGGSGYDGYFIDDNTFGSTYASSSNCNPWRDDGAISATHISEGVNDFGGLCLECHTATNLQNINYSNGTDANIYVHNTVKGWFNTSKRSDLFKDYHTSQHSMAYYNTAPDSGNTWCSVAYWRMPSGYRWSVNPGSQTGITTSGNWDDESAQASQPPSDTGGQSTDGALESTSFHQFPCAKCHAPHATKLPRLMKTNCLDVGSTALSSAGGSPTHNNGYTFGDCDADTGDTQKYKPMICHGGGPEATTNAGDWNGAGNQSGQGGWNTKTGW